MLRGLNKRTAGFIIFAVLVIAVCFAACRIIDGNVKYDIEIIAAPQYSLTSKEIAELKELAAEVGADLDGDGKVRVNVRHYPVNIPEGGGIGDISTLNILDTLMAASPREVIYIMDKMVAHRYEPDFFEYPSDWGIDCETENGTLIPVTDNSFFSRLFAPDRELYIALRGCVERSNEEYIALYNSAADVINHLLAQE